MEIDHIFIAVESSEQANKFFDLGFTESEGRRHIGQGTANRVAIFNNLFLEFLFPVDVEELTSPTTLKTTLFQRLTRKDDGNISPFGVCFRPSKKGFSFTMESWNYQPEYLPSSISIPVSIQGVNEPMWFFLSFGKAPKSWKDKKVNTHQNSVEKVTKVKITCNQFSDETRRELADIKKLKLVEAKPDTPAGSIHLLELEFDGGQQGLSYDLRPSLPLKLKL